MSKTKGTVTGCGKGKFSYFITLDTRDGFYFNTKYEPKCGKGDVVGIEYDQKAENRGNVRKVVVLESNSSGYEDTSRKPDSGGGGYSGGASGGKDRQDSIVWQSSRKDALVLAGILVSSESIKLPKAPDARRTIIEALIAESTVKYFADASDPKASKTFKDEAGIEEDAEGEPEKEAGDDWNEGDAKKKDGGDWDEWDD